MTQTSHLSSAPLRSVDVSTHDETRNDLLAAEAPLQVSVNGRRYAVLMRTPSTHIESDLDLTAGFLFSEGIVEDRHDFAALGHCTDPANRLGEHSVIVHLQSGAIVPESIRSLQRSTSVIPGCGVCGRMDIDALSPPFPERKDYPKPSTDFVHSLPTKLKRLQPLFSKTGGLHGAAVFGVSGQLIMSAEDVGRHNAVDKVIGHCVRHDEAVLQGSILVVSSRLSFDLVQKALMARLGSLVGVGAASDLAHNIAQKNGLHLFSFTRPDSSNYHFTA